MKRLGIKATIVQERARVRADLEADKAADWSLTPDAEPVDLTPLRDAIEGEMSKSERRHARRDAFRQQGDLL